MLFQVDPLLIEYEYGHALDDVGNVLKGGLNVHVVGVVNVASAV